MTKKITKRRLTQIIREETEKVIKLKESSRGYKHQSSREPGRGSLGSVAMPEPKSSSSSITIENPAAFYKNMIELYTKVGMPDAAASMQKELDNLASPMAPDAPDMEMGSPAKQMKLPGMGMAPEDEL